ncbi:hypothetical protein B5C34_07515 [Pacificimonas flava]|uniref:Acylase n=3 Tax=Sphingosinicellaceae TaxID=2820280 RepID=A0A219B937_9SPHN|nr:penicillin acylase family protein [Pacificimonas aurantium]OWV34684.1 hypothetical protein B5C34_07515 [Pacificimonas flava]
MLWEPLTAASYAPPPSRDYDVEIVRDEFGVPHVFGATDADVAYGVAWAHAEDDFTTLQDVVLQTRGRYGTVAGADGAAIDFAYHLLGARETATRDYAKLSEATRAIVEAYAAGLNAFAEANPGQVKRMSLFPTTGIDVVTGFVLRSPFFYGLDGVISPLVAGELPPRPPVTLVAEEKGSNAFALSPSGTTDGATRLVINSHQPWTGAVAWYELHVKSDEGLNFAGANFPGSPFPLLGHNRHLGWANTVNRPDLVDTYRLVLDESGERYRFGEEWLPLESRRIWLRVGFGPLTVPVPRTVHRSVHGPVIVNARGAFAVRYAGIDDARGIEQYVRLPKAENFAEWKDVMAMQAVHGTNFVYADEAGNIGLLYNASFPQRAEGYDWAGVLPGDDPDALWMDYVQPEEIPALYNPPSGFIANANNSPWVASADADNLRPEDYPRRLGVEDRVTNRALRMMEIYREDEDGRLSREELLALKFDKGYSRDPSGWPAGWWKLLMAVEPQSEDEQAAKRLLATWDWSLDGEGDADALAAYVMQDGARRGYQGEEMGGAAETLSRATEKLLLHFGRLDPPLQDVLRVRRGSADVGTTGGPEALRAIYYAEEPDGRLRGTIGDSFIMLVEWQADGELKSSSIHQFGSAVERPGTPHYNSQVEMFAREEWKPVLLDEAAVRARAAEIYRPGDARSGDGKR